ncbi:S41 family peptidase [Chloracidobacterium thermophilum]|uniref:S41 family peptidase n=1 Tax=Chloracidobacterium thermophilum TaxID=458033 RepID=UPI0007398A31|nr:S41 family peptidase [Chloracidobacterium thermophilum]
MKSVPRTPSRLAAGVLSLVCVTCLTGFPVLVGGSGRGLVQAQEVEFGLGPEPGDAWKGKAVTTAYVEALTLAEEHYAGPIDHERLCDAAATGMLRTLDPHSNFFTREEFNEFRSQQQANYSGIGSLITQHGNKVYIWSPIADTPAYRAGLRYGDEIIAVDGESTEGWDVSKVRSRLRGLRSTAVTVTVNRPGESSPITVRIVRDSVGQPSVSNVFMLTPEVGYLAFRRGFAQASGEEVAAAVRQLKAQGAKAIVFDQRDNPGGLVDAARAIAELFLQRGQKIVSIRGRTPRGMTYENALTANNPNPEDIPLVVLINGGSASAAEILAGALQDHDRALLVGETTFGKGLVQTPYRLPDGYGLTLTSAKYYTPTGRLIQRRYDNVSLYDYQRRRSRTEATGKDGLTKYLTDGKRTVYGGLGITPDVEVKGETYTLAQGQLTSLTFLFGRLLANGQVEGFAQYRVPRDVDYNHTLQDSDYPITDQLLAAFKTFAQPRLQEFGIAPTALAGNDAFLRQQLRREILTAAYGFDTAQEVIIREEAVVKRAIAEVPQSRSLAENARRLTPSPLRPTNSFKN